MDSQRKIIHIDMDAFFASVEQRDQPEYRGHPLVVGYAGSRSVVAAASYEARQFGIRSAMAMAKALSLCPTLIVVPPQMSAYKAVSQQIRAIFLEYTDLVEPLSLDEAFLDVTHNKKAIPSASWVAREICATIQERIGLTASAGVSFNKFLAKVASGMNKPNGLTLISPERAPAFVAALPIEKFFGVGKVTAEKMHRLGIQTGADLLSFSLPELEALFGKAGRSYYHIVRNEDSRPVNPDQERHSVGAEKTFERDLYTRAEMMRQLELIAQELVRRLEKNQFVGKSLTLKVKLADFQQITRSRTMEYPLQDIQEIMAVTRHLLTKVEIPRQGVRLLGLTVAHHCPEGAGIRRQLLLPLFAEAAEERFF